MTATDQAIAAGFPEPYYQPVGSADCGFYAIAYLARCLGHPEVTADQVKQWRHATGRHEERFIPAVLGHDRRSWWDDRDDDEERRRWWLGAGGASTDWVRYWLDAGWLGVAVVHRIAGMGHSVAVLGATEEGALIMDPYPGFGGHVVEPWDWFLGSGPGNHGCHRIDAWYRR